MKLLVEEGKAEVDKAKYNGCTPLIASQEGELEIVQCLVEKGKAEVDMVLDNGCRLLLMASQNRHLEIVKYLKGKGAKVRGGGEKNTK